jgi:hypothetical protein
VGEGGLAADPTDVLAEGHQELAGVKCPDAKEVQCAWRGGGDERSELVIEMADLGVEVNDTPGHAAQGGLGGLGGAGETGGVGAQASAQGCLASQGLACGKRFAQLDRRGDDELAESTKSSGGGLDDRFASDAQLADRLDHTGGVFGRHSRLARSDAAGGAFRVDRV